MAAVLNRSKSKGTARLVLLGIANHDGDGGSWPSVATLARYANVSERAVQDALASLQRLGELVVQRNAGGTHTTRNDRRPNRYLITLDDGVQDTAPRDPDGVQPDALRGAGQRADGVNAPAPEPSIEPSTTPSPAGLVATPRRACQLPDGYRPNPTHQRIADELGLNLAAVFEQFCDHHRARGSTFKDWDAALRTWLRNVPKFGGPGAGRTATTTQRVNDALAVAERLAGQPAPSLTGGLR